MTPLFLCGAFIKRPTTSDPPPRATLFLSPDNPGTFPPLCPGWTSLGPSHGHSPLIFFFGEKSSITNWCPYLFNAFAESLSSATMVMDRTLIYGVISPRRPFSREYSIETYNTLIFLFSPNISRLRTKVMHAASGLTNATFVQETSRSERRRPHGAPPRTVNVFE